MLNQNVKQTFGEHLDELRDALIKTSVLVVATAILSFFLKDLLFGIVLAPKYDDFVTYQIFDQINILIGSEIKGFNIELINTSLAEQFIIHLRVAFYSGILLSSPYILYRLILFISPALYPEEKKYTNSVVLSAYVMFILGSLISYFLIFPLTFRFLGTYQVSSDVGNLISLDSYISTFFSMSLIMGVMFELPIVCWLLTKLNILTADAMRHYRKHAIVCILTISAIITPTSDIFTLSLVGFPVWLLYEISVFVVSRVKG